MHLVWLSVRLLYIPWNTSNLDAATPLNCLIVLLFFENISYAEEEEKTNSIPTKLTSDRNELLICLVFIYSISVCNLCPLLIVQRHHGCPKITSYNAMDRRVSPMNWSNHNDYFNFNGYLNFVNEKNYGVGIFFFFNVMLIM